MKTRVLERQEKRLTTKENWYPTCEDGTVRASMLELSTGQWRVCLWGADDFGLERDFNTRADAVETFRKLRDGTTQKELRAAGFQPA